MLVDTSVWIDHFRRGNAQLAQSLEEAGVRCHPFIIGELACGKLADRDTILPLLARLPQAPQAEHAEVLRFVELHDLAGSGIGWIDAHLLAAAKLANVRIWTLDKPLAAAARRVGL